MASAPPPPPVVALPLLALPAPDTRATASASPAAALSADVPPPVYVRVDSVAQAQDAAYVNALYPPAIEAAAPVAATADAALIELPSISRIAELMPELPPPPPIPEDEQMPPPPLVYEVPSESLAP
jgi:hypothetical protein